MPRELNPKSISKKQSSDDEVLEVIEIDDSDDEDKVKDRYIDLSNNDVSIDSSQLKTSIKIKQEETVSVNVDGRNKILSSSLLKIKTNVKHEENSSDNMEDMNVSNNDKEIIYQQLEQDINNNESSIIKQHMHQVSPSVNANDFDFINNNASSINKSPSVINGINLI